VAVEEDQTPEPVATGEKRALQERSAADAAETSVAMLAEPAASRLDGGGVRHGGHPEDAPGPGMYQRLKDYVASALDPKGATSNQDYYSRLAKSAGAAAALGGGGTLAGGAVVVAVAAAMAGAMVIVPGAVTQAVSIGVSSPPGSPPLPADGAGLMLHGCQLLASPRSAWPAPGLMSPPRAFHVSAPLAATSCTFAVAASAWLSPRPTERTPRV
jgi:hypothetical protein